MDGHWEAISEEHKAKVRTLAEKNGIGVEQAFRNLLKMLEWEMSGELRPGKFEEMVTIREIERMLDQVTE